MNFSANIEIDFKRELIFALHADLSVSEFLGKTCEVLAAVCDIPYINFVEIDKDQFLSYGRWNGKQISTEHNRFSSPALTDVLKSADSVTKAMQELFALPISGSLIVPVLSKNEIAGCIALGFTKQTDLSATQIDFVEDIASYISLYKQRERYVLTIQELTKTNEGRQTQIDDLVSKASLTGVTSDVLSGLSIAFSRVLSVLLDTNDKKNAPELLAELKAFQNVFLNSTELLVVGQENDTDINSVLSDTLTEIKELLQEQSLTNEINFASRDRELVMCDKHLAEKIIRSLLLLISTKENKTIRICSKPQGNRLNIEFGLGQEMEVGLAFEILMLLSKQAGIDMVYHDKTISISFKKVAYTVPVQIAPDKAEIKLMVVDDDDSLRELMMDILESRNYKVVCCSDGRIALSLFHKGEFDMLITDLGLPHVSGSQLAAQVKAIDPKIPIIMMTGWGAESFDKNINPSVDYVLSKPFNLNDFLATIENGIQSHV